MCLRIIIELHKQYRPPICPEVGNFLQFVKNIYKELPNHLNKIFEPQTPIKVKDISEINVEAMLADTFTTTAIGTEKKNPDNQPVSVSYEFCACACALRTEFINAPLSLLLHLFVKMSCCPRYHTDSPSLCFSIISSPKP